MKSVLAGAVLVLVSALPPLSSLSAQETDARCNDVFDKVACTCAVRNGGRSRPCQDKAPGVPISGAFAAPEKK